MYAGGGVLGDAMAVQLFDADGDGTWTGTVTMNTGVTGNYIFLNSPSNGGDWGTKEDLNGQSCGDPNNYNDRTLPTIISDTTMLHCFGSCESDGTCPAPPTVFIDVTFTLNISSIISSGGTVDPTGMFLAGGAAFGNPGDNPMTDLGNGVWSITVNKPEGFTSDYTFTNGNSGWGAKENISGLSCAVPPYDDRNLSPVYSDTTIQHCFGTCDYDGSCASAVIPPNYTFLLDMNQSGYGASAVPHLRGSWNWGAAATDDMMIDTDGDGVWEITKSINGGAEYLFAVDTDADGAWDVNESNDPTEACTNGNSQYTNRVLTQAIGDTSLGLVCLGSCSPCVYPGTCGFFTLELTDSYGDGWNGGSMDVVVNGTAVFSGLTIVTGTGPDIYQIPVDIGDVVDFNYTAGSYAGENSYQVFDNNSVLIVDEGPGSSSPTSVTGVSACPACPEPSGLTATNITTSSADLSWTAGGSETEWFIILNGVGTSVSSTSFTATGLNDNTLYNCAVHAICAPGDTSVSASTFSFTTIPAPGTCGFFTLELTDSYGDGWNGGSMDVVVNGTAVFSGLTIVTGTGPDIYQIPVDIGDVVDFNYTAGSLLVKILTKYLTIIQY